MLLSPERALQARGVLLYVSVHTRIRSEYFLAALKRDWEGAGDIEREGGKEG